MPRSGIHEPIVPVLLTRPAEEAAILAAKLGPHAVVAPCVLFEDLPATRPDLPHADLLVASPRAAPCLARLGLHPTWRVLALAPATAEALRAHHLRVDHALVGGAAALARATRPGAPVLAATSDLGGSEVLSVRPDAHLWPLYRTACPSALPASACAAMRGPFDVWFTSPSAVRNFIDLAPGALERARRVLCHGATTLAEVRRCGRSGEQAPLP